MSMMASDIRLALDPALIGERIGIELDPWQAEVIRERPRRGLWLCARQCGKTEAAIILAEHCALYEPGSLILIVSPSQRQSGETFRRLMLLHAKLKEAPPLVAESALRAEYGNGSRCVALPGSERTVRGYARAKLIIIDEGARCPDELMAALRPTMATVDGSLIALSTPAGKRGWFYESWIDGGDDWHRVKVSAEQCPRLSEAFLREEMRSLGPMMYRQEYCLEFIDDGEAVFPVELVSRAFSDQVTAIW